VRSDTALPNLCAGRLELSHSHDLSSGWSYNNAAYNVAYLLLQYSTTNMSSSVPSRV